MWRLAQHPVPGPAGGDAKPMVSITQLLTKLSPRAQEAQEEGVEAQRKKTQQKQQEQPDFVNGLQLQNDPNTKKESLEGEKKESPPTPLRGEVGEEADPQEPNAGAGHSGWLQAGRRQRRPWSPARLQRCRDRGHGRRDGGMVESQRPSCRSPQG
jgi:hypothetical protein